MFFYIKQHKHIALHQIMFFLATSYDPFKKKKKVLLHKHHISSAMVNLLAQTCQTASNLFWSVTIYYFHSLLLDIVFPHTGLVEKMHLLMIFCFHANNR